jgi:hypothetical protein
MAWFLNYYTCDRCGEDWTDEWSCTCDDDCPECGARHMSPDDSDNLTYVIERRAGMYVVLWSPETAEHSPDYRELASFPTRQEVRRWLSVDDSDIEMADDSDAEA